MFMQNRDNDIVFKDMITGTKLSAARFYSATITQEMVDQARSLLPLSIRHKLSFSTGQLNKLLFSDTKSLYKNLGSEFFT